MLSAGLASLNYNIFLTSDSQQPWMTRATVSLARPFTITAIVSGVIHGSNNSNKTPVGSFYAIPPVHKHEGKETEVPERPVAS